MNKSVVVFDFDKTLTDKDTLFGFYRAVAMTAPLFPVKRILLIAAGVLYKVGVINNGMLKRIGIQLFLKGIRRDELEDAARRYGEKIELNEIYSNHYQKTDGEKWILSASPEIYLKHLFPGELVAGTTLRYAEDKVTGLDTNMFGEEKKTFLVRKGITRIDKLYTDSVADRSLMEIAEDVYIVSNGHVIQAR